MAATLIASTVTKAPHNTNVFVPSAGFTLEPNDVLVFTVCYYYGLARVITSLQTMDAELFRAYGAATDVMAFTGVRIVTTPGTEPGTYGFESTSSGEWVAVAHQYRGVNTDTITGGSTPVPITYSEGLNDGNPPAKGLTTTQPNQLVITSRHVCNGSDAITAASGPPGTFTTAGFGVEQGGGDSAIAEAAYLIVPGSSTVVTPGDWTGVPDSTSEYVTMSFALDSTATDGGGWNAGIGVAGQVLE